MPEPADLAGYMRRGWAFHSRGLNEQAEVDFRKAISLAPDSVDANYVLGLVLKAQGRKEEAILAFTRTIELLDGGALEDPTRGEMLRRLARAHVNDLTIGDWNLEETIWRHRN